MAKKIIMYGNAACKDCVEAKEILDREGIRYGYVDVLGGLAHLKKFITLRDAHPVEFQSEIAKEHMGIPCFVVDDKDVYVLLPDLEVFRKASKYTAAANPAAFFIFQKICHLSLCSPV